MAIAIVLGADKPTPCNNPADHHPKKTLRINTDQTGYYKHCKTHINNGFLPRLSEIGPKSKRANPKTKKYHCDQ